MSLIQITFMENSEAVASGYELRNRANLSDLSIYLNDTSTFEIGLRPDVTSSPSARIVRALDQGDVDRMLETVARLRPDFVLVEGVTLFQALEALRRTFPALPLIVDMHNIESLLLADADRARLPVALRPLAGFLKRKQHQAEIEADRRAVQLASMVWTCSDQDAALARKHLGAQVVRVVANPVPDWCAESEVQDRTAPAAPVVLFVGHLGYPPNRQAVARLCTGIMPALQHLEPSARLVVAGRNPARRVLRTIRSAGHTLVANPTDLGPLYAAAMATAIPLAQGGGTRIKVLEALAVGCPVVASAKAVEGLGLRDGLDYLAAETDAAFAAALARLVRSPDLRAALIQGGHAVIEARYAPPARRESIARALHGLRP